MDKIKNIIFDYDGTIHNSIKIYAPAFRKAYSYLVENKYVQEKEFTDKEISKWLGFSSKDMWNNFMPNLPDKEKQKCSNIIGTNMIKFIKENKAEMYEDAIEVLEYLKEKEFKLIFLSNCKVEYMNIHKEKFSLDKYFDDFYCTEEFDFIPKYEIFHIISKKYKGDFIVIGDRFQDIEISKVHNLYSIGCIYGYGDKKELSDASFVVDSVLEIKKYLS